MINRVEMAWQPFEANVIEWDAMDWPREDSPPHNQLQDVGYDLDIFDNPVLARDFECILCLFVVKDPVIHRHPGCRAIFCRNCVNLYTQHRVHSTDLFPQCPHRCGAHLTPDSIQSLVDERLNSLLMRCHRGCNSYVPYPEYEVHCNSCNGIAIPPHAARLQMLETNLEAAQAEIRRLTDMCNRQQEEINTLRSNAHSSGLSNPIRSRDEYRNETQFLCQYGDQEVEISGLPLESFGSVLRQQLEQRFNTRLGPILKFDHTPISSNLRLRQHQIGRKPVRLIALPFGRSLPVGQTLHITIGSNGPIV